MKWLKVDELKIIDMIKNGYTYDDISIKVSRSKKSVKEKLSKLGHTYLMYNKRKELFEKVCPVCDKVFSVSKNDKDQMLRIYCSHSCAAIESNKKRKKNKKKEKTCLNCNNKINIKQKYCCKKCQNDYQHKQYISKWKNGEIDGMVGNIQISNHIRKYLFKKYDNKCSRCGWNEINEFTKKKPLEVEHIDGNYKNNLEENLTLLCPNCHSLTKTYKGANRGNGRLSRLMKIHKQNIMIKDGSYNYNHMEISEENKCVDCDKKIQKNSKRCPSCNGIKNRKVKNRPLKEVLLKEVNEIGYSATGRKYNVSDNAIRKWLK